MIQNDTTIHGSDVIWYHIVGGSQQRKLSCNYQMVMNYDMQTWIIIKKHYSNYSRSRYMKTQEVQNTEHSYRTIDLGQNLFACIFKYSLAITYWYLAAHRETS